MNLPRLGSSGENISAIGPVASALLRQSPTTNATKYERLFQSNIVGIIVADVHGSVFEANDFFLELLGYERDDLPLRWDTMTPSRWHDMDQAKINEVLSTGAGAPWEKEYYAKDGRRVPVVVAAALLDEASGRCIALVLDLTRRKQIEKRLILRKVQLQRLAAQLVLAEEAERRRVAHGLHGEIGHTLATARIKLGALPGGSPVADESIEEIRVLLDDAIATTRSLTFELTSPVLYELGLEAALTSLGNRMEEEHGVHFHCGTDGQLKARVEDRSILLYRIGRELLLNVVKHAQAGNLWLRMEHDQDHLHVTVRDDGVGFDITRLENNFDRYGGFGLFNIRQQLDYIGGSLEIDSAPGDGTCVVVTVPLTEGTPYDRGTDGYDPL